MERYVQDSDPELTTRGAEDSLDTGLELMKYLHSQGLLNEEAKGFKFVSSVMHRCLQTISQVRKGMLQYASENAGELPFNWRDYLKLQPTCIEEACTEKTEAKEITPVFFEEVRYLAEQDKLFSDFMEINPKAGALFEYKGQDAKFSIRAKIKDHKVKKKICEEFFSKILIHMREDTLADKYIIVGHNQNLNKLSSYFGGKAHKSVEYNSCSIVEVDLSSIQRPPPVRVLIENKRLTLREGEHVDKTAICKSNFMKLEHLNLRKSSRLFLMRQDLH